MRRPHLFLFSGLFLLSCACLQAQTNAAFMNRIVHARYVMVTTENGDSFDPKINPDDRSAAGAIQNKISDWKRYTLVYRKEDADIIIAVRTGGRVRANGGIHIGTQSQDTGRNLPGSLPTNKTTTTIGPTATADAGPKDDLFSVYDAADYPTSSVLWRREQKDGLGYPTFPLFEQFKKDVEKTASKKKP